MDRLGRQLLPQATLADACFTQDSHHLTGTAPHVIQSLTQLRQLSLPADQLGLTDGRLGQHPVGQRPKWRRRGHGRGVGEKRRWALAEDRLIELLGFGLGLRAQLALHDRDAMLVLPERRAPPPQARVEAHEAPMHGLLQWVEREQPQGRLHRRLGRSGLALVGEDLREPLHRQLPEPLPLRRQPLFKRRLVDGQAGQQISPVQHRRPLERGRRSLFHGLLEARHVHLHAFRVQGERLPVR